MNTIKSIAIRQQDDWYLVNLPGVSQIAKNSIAVEINIAEEAEDQKLDYKDFRDSVIMDRYNEKLKRQIIEEPANNLLLAFDEKFNTSDINSFDDVLNKL